MEHGGDMEGREYGAVDSLPKTQSWTLYSLTSMATDYWLLATGDRLLVVALAASYVLPCACCILLTADYSLLTTYSFLHLFDTCYLTLHVLLTSYSVQSCHGK